MTRRNEFEGTLVRLRAVEPEDADVWYASGLDTETDRRGGFTHLPSSRSAYRERAMEASKAPEGDSVSLMIETLDGVVVGGLGVGGNRRTRVFDYGIGVGREHWRKGYGTEALQLLFRFYFLELGYQKVETGVYAFNEPSLRFHETFGFAVEGRRRRAVFTRGEYHDVVLFGMTCEEFMTRHG
ncbi:MAG: GNAT family N-acetyltransferase [Actinomycetota bacterium]|nr:GNAT family N-acetyltransferase [Actinomycetota bacterium]